MNIQIKPHQDNLNEVKDGNYRAAPGIYYKSITATGTG